MLLPYRLLNVELLLPLIQTKVEFLQHGQQLAWSAHDILSHGDTAHSKYYCIFTENHFKLQKLPCVGGNSICQ